jgi:hypothetical protein
LNTECTARLSQDGNRSICTTANGFNGSCPVLLVSSGYCGERADRLTGEQAWVESVCARGAPASTCTAAAVRAALAAPVLLPPAGHLDGVTTSHRAKGMNPVRTIELYRNEASRNIDAIQLFYQGKVRQPLCRA